MPAGPPDSTRYAAWYEMLRARLTTAGGPAAEMALDTRSLRLALLLDEGLPAWLHAIAPLLVARAAAPDVAPRSARSSDGSPSDIAALASEVVPITQQREIALLLANLVLSTRLSPRGPHHPAASPIPRDHGGCRC